MLAVADIGACVGVQNKIGHPAGCRFPWSVPAENKYAKKQNKNTHMNCGIMTCEMNNRETE